MASRFVARSAMSTEERHHDNLRRRQRRLRSQARFCSRLAQAASLLQHRGSQPSAALDAMLQLHQVSLAAPSPEIVPLPSFVGTWEPLHSGELLGVWEPLHPEDSAAPPISCPAPEQEVPTPPLPPTPPDDPPIAPSPPPPPPAAVTRKKPKTQRQLWRRLEAEDLEKWQQRERERDQARRDTIEQDLLALAHRRAQLPPPP